MDQLHAPTEGRKFYRIIQRPFDSLLSQLPRFFSSTRRLLHIVELLLFRFIAIADLYTVSI